MQGGKKRDRPRYDGRDEIGEDPFHYLYVGEVVEDGYNQLDGEGDPLLQAKARIQGIVREDRLDAFQECEVELGPRKQVIGWINQRKAQLEADETQPARADTMTRQAAADGGADE